MTPTWIAPRPGEFFAWSEFCQTTTPGFTSAALLDDLASARTYQARLIALCAAVLDPLRREVGPLRITSGYRSTALNAAIKGAAGSDHMFGSAVDVKLVRGHDAAALLAVVRRLGLPVDQAIGYAVERGGHVHLSYRLGEVPRGQWLWAPAAGGFVAWGGEE